MSNGKRSIEKKKAWGEIEYSRPTYLRVHAFRAIEHRLGAFARLGWSAGLPGRR